MPIEVTWMEPNNISHAVLSGDVTQQEIDQWMTQAETMINSHNNIQHVVVDMRPKPRLALNVMKLSSVIKASKHPRTGWLCAVGTTPLTSFWLEMFHRTINLKFKVFANTEDAREFLEAIIRIEREKNEAAANR